MQRRILGSSGIVVSRLALGAMTFGTRMPPISNVDRVAAREMFEQALASGVNFIDTADSYSAGESEEILAPLLASHRDDVLLATKLGWGRAHERPLSGENVTASVEDSLRRLGTDRIDVLYLHLPDRRTAVGETFDALDGLVGRGLVRSVGVSNWSAGEVGDVTGRQRTLGQVDLSSVQVYWSLVGRDVEQEIVPTCRRLGIGVVVWSPLAGGYLTGRTDGRRTTWAFPPVEDTLGQRVLAVVRQVAADLGSTPATVALGWLLARPEVDSVIVGASTVAQLEQNLAATSLELDDTHLAALDVASDIAPIYPRWWDDAMGVA